MIITGLVHILVSALLALLLGNLFNGLSPVLAFISLGGGMLIALLGREFISAENLKFDLRNLNWIELLLLVFIVVVGFRHFGWMFYQADFTFKTLSPNNLGDLPLHLNYIRQIAAGAEFPLMNPEFSLEPLYYPYALDLYNGLWETLGVPTTSHLFLVGMFLLIASFAALRAWAGWLGIIAFFLNGGWAGWQVLQDGQFLDYQGQLAWKNFFLTLFITQRGIMFALPAGLLILIALRKTCEHPLSGTRNSLLAIGVLWGGMAFFHLHSFFAVSVIAVVSAAMFRQLNSLKVALYTAVPIGSYFVLYSTEFLQKAGVIRLQWGWTAGEQPLLSFWWLNLGPWMLLFAGILIVLVIRRRWLLLSEFGFHAVLFLAFSWIMLAPWDWDNIKLLIWPYLGMIAIAWRCLPDAGVAEKLPLPQRYGLQTGYGAAALALGFGGLVSVLSSLSPEQDSTVVYQSRELWNMEGAVRDLPHDAVFIAAPTYNHALTYLGHSRVLGYEGHVWSHGIDASTVAAAQMRIYSGDANWQNLARELRATHLVWGPHERSQYGNPELPWRAQLENISDVPEIEIYALN